MLKSLHQKVPDDVVARVFARETASAESRNLDLEFLKTDLAKMAPGNRFGIPADNSADNLRNDNAQQVRAAVAAASVAATYPTCTSFRMVCSCSTCQPTA